MNILDRNYSNKVCNFQGILNDGYRRFNKQLINIIESRKEKIIRRNIVDKQYIIR